MNGIANLLILFAGILLLNIILSALLWAKNRTGLHRAVLMLWIASVINFVIQGALRGSDLQLIAGVTSIFLVNLSQAYLLSLMVRGKLALRLYTGILCVGLGASTGLHFIGFEFMWAALPVVVAVCVPVAHVLLKYVAPAYKQLTFTGKGLAVVSASAVLHTLDYPFLANVEAFAPVGFVLALLLIFALSIFAPAMVLEISTEQEARNSAEMDVARHIQTSLLPRTPQIAGHEIECYMKPAEEVGGDYYDVFTLGGYTWILLGDVTGHGLRSGLVMLMAQSILRSIVQARNDVSPRELNTLANRVLYENLQRLGENRTMTIVSFSCKADDGDEFAFNGAHDDVYIWRADTRQVDVIEVGHFPLGLGLMKDVQPMMRPETRVQLAEGDLLFLGTDGITEAAAGGDYMKGMFEEEGLVNFLSKNGHLPLEEIKVALVEEMNSFTQGVFHDDVTFMMLRKSSS